MTLKLGTFDSQIKVEVPKPNAPQYLFLFITIEQRDQMSREKEPDLHYSSYKKWTNPYESF